MSAAATVNKKQIPILLLVLTIVTTIGLVTAQTVQQQQAQAQLLQKKPGNQGNQQGGNQNKKTQCNNVKIMAVVTNLDTTQGQVTLTGSATLNGQTVQKTISVNATDPSTADGVGLPLFFKKMFSPCPALGSTFSGMVNGITFDGVLQSIRSPNFVEIDLGGATGQTALGETQ